MLLAQVTDIHLGFDPDNPVEFNRKRLDHALKLLCEMTPRPDVLLATGDLTDRGDQESYRQLKMSYRTCRSRSICALAITTCAHRFVSSFRKYRRLMVSCNMKLMTVLCGC